jgi:hypothetical protein
MAETETMIASRRVAQAEITLTRAIEGFNAVVLRQRADPQNEDLAVELAGAQVLLDFARGAHDHSAEALDLANARAANAEARAPAADYPALGTPIFLCLPCVFRSLLLTTRLSSIARSTLPYRFTIYRLLFDSRIFLLFTIPHFGIVEDRLDVVFAVFYLLFVVAKAGGAISGLGGAEDRGYFGITQRAADCAFAIVAAFVNPFALRSLPPLGLRLVALAYVIVVFSLV